MVATSKELLDRAILLETAAEDLRSEAYSLRHAQYWPPAVDRMEQVADKLDRLALKIRVDAA